LIAGVKSNKNCINSSSSSSNSNGSNNNNNNNSNTACIVGSLSFGNFFRLYRF